MLRETIFLGVVAASLMVEACPPSPSPPQPDSGDAAPPAPKDGGTTDTNIACASMALALCNEGLDPKCSATLQHAVDSRLVRGLDAAAVKCLADAKSKEAVRYCTGGAVACP